MQLPLEAIIGAAAPVFLLLVLGFTLRKTTVLGKEADRSVMKLIIRVFYPCLFLDFLIGNPAVKEAPNLLAAPVIGYVTTAGGFIAGYLLARAIGLTRGKGLRTFAFCNGIYNYGYIPIPLIIALFDDRRTLGILLVHNVGVEAAIWTAGMLLLAGKVDKGSLRRLANPPLLALLAALCINGVGLDAHIPEWGYRLVHMLGACSIPMGILLSGTAVADLCAKRGFLGNFRIHAGSIGLRLCLLPSLFVAVASWMPGLSTELKQVMLVQAAMPAGLLPIVLVGHYGGEPSVAVKVVLTTTCAAVLTMPLWLKVGALLIF